MRDYKLTNNCFDFSTLLDVKSRIIVGEHPVISVVGHIQDDTDDLVLRRQVGKNIVFEITDNKGVSQIIFSGMIDNISISFENDLRVLHVDCISFTVKADINPYVRTYQNKKMTYDQVLGVMEKYSGNFSCLIPKHGDTETGAMLVQYGETDWQFAKRLASRLNTVVVPNYTLSTPYFSIGMPKKIGSFSIDPISYKIKKDVCMYMDYSAPGGIEGFSERDAVSYEVKCRDLLELCQPVSLFGTTLYVYGIESEYTGHELVHTYILKEQSGFCTKEFHNNDLIGVSLEGIVREVKEDHVRVDILNDVKQTKHKWFLYATPYSSPDGPGWYFMPEIGDSVRLQFPTEVEDASYVSSSIHITHGERTDPRIKYIRTVYNQEIRFEPSKLIITDGHGSTITFDHEKGVFLNTDKRILIESEAGIDVSAKGKIEAVGKIGILLKQNESKVSIRQTIDIASQHTRIQ